MWLWIYFFFKKEIVSVSETSYSLCNQFDFLWLQANISKARSRNHPEKSRKKCGEEFIKPRALLQLSCWYSVHLKTTFQQYLKAKSCLCHHDPLSRPRSQWTCINRHTNHSRGLTVGNPVSWLGDVVDELLSKVPRGCYLLEVNLMNRLPVSVRPDALYAEGELDSC